MTTSAPTDCACRESPMASAVLVAPVCAITGTRRAAWSTTVSTTRRRSSTAQRGELAGGAARHDPVHASVDRPVHQRPQRGLVDAAVGGEGGGERGQDAAELHCHLFLLLGYGVSRRRAGGRGPLALLALGGEQARGLLRGGEAGRDRGLGVEGAEVVAGQEDPAAPPRQGRLQRAPAREAVGGSRSPSAGPAPRRRSRRSRCRGPGPGRRCRCAGSPRRSWPAACAPGRPGRTS